MKNTPLHTGLLLILFLLAGCSAQKNTGLSRAYHGLTAKYNVLFNASESYKKGLEKIDKDFVDDYSEILPLFNYSSKEVVSVAGSDMDRTIKKCSKLITLHSITAKPKVKDNKNLTPNQRAFFSKKEYNVFVDDAYLLMGKAHFYKHEFELASDIFRRLINDFKNQPAAFEAQIWLSRIYTENGQYIPASEILSSLINNASLPKKALPEFYTTYADYQLKQQNYAGAIELLEKALACEKRKKQRTRYLFILAQLAEKTGELKKASEYYSQVIKMNPVYDMAFNAQINRALAYEQGFGQADVIETELNKMLHDDKNIEYQDQVYYALGNLAIKEGDEQKALAYYTQSIAANKGNEQQKVRSYLTLANHYYAIPDYPNAQAYYDSAVAHIDPDYPGYNAIFTKSKSLTRLVNEINTVKLADSVLILAALPEAERNKVIDKIIEDERKAEEEARLKQQEEQLNQQFDNEAALRNTMRQPMATGSTVKWYFYNDAAKDLGYREFRTRWGNRKLEDHWQRTVKAMVTGMPGTGTETDEISANDVKAEPAYGKMSREYYLVNIPFTDSAVEATHKKTEEALYNMGVIYRDELKDLGKAGESFRELVKRYPGSPSLLPAYYQLYRIAKDENNPAMADYYKNLIIGKFPESMYAQVLSDPEYFRELEKQDQAVRDYYKQSYELYLQGNYSEVIARSANAVRIYPNHTLLPQFTYLGVLAEGKTIDRALFREKLVAITKTYPKTDIAADAQNLIRYMDTDHPELKQAEEIQISQELYAYNPDFSHVFAYAVDRRANVNQLVFNIINFNLDHFDNLNLIVEIIDLSNAQNLITVKTFPNALEANGYLNAISASPDILKDMPEITLTPFVISSFNLKTLREDKSFDRYMLFYNQNYQ